MTENLDTRISEVENQSAKLIKSSSILPRVSHSTKGLKMRTKLVHLIGKRVSVWSHGRSWHITGRLWFCDDDCYVVSVLDKEKREGGVCYLTDASVFSVGIEDFNTEIIMTKEYGDG